MPIEDIKGYRPHTDDKIETVNRIKSLEAELGKLFTELETNLVNEWSIIHAMDESLEADAAFDDNSERHRQVATAKERLKEASMWACRAVFRPEEFY
ncbi:hypothetical protein [Serratia phage X20]|uniref:Acb2/Tad1 hairpin domain-containing protein n=3 Tax=Winklervirus TaxID=2560256 RepID=A0A1Z1LZ20_9CAUD|nr:hypothetical protein FDI23_gp120 [Serratia phage CHI14]YP_010092269.1 hypothetical protein KNT72_gp118 [Serratia phage X20]ARW57543.1 hypothetical protein [Serratia phage CHI14]ARW57818.1 hypothetical protein [Serratia phage CBH8]ARW58091.1 hypothetical protein [Serratia phage X20]